MQLTINCHAYAAEWMDIESILSGKDTPILTLAPEHLSESDTVLGTAVLTVDAGSAEQLSAKQLDRLQALLETLRADNQKRENALIDRISKLQAIGFSAA